MVEKISLSYVHKALNDIEVSQHLHFFTGLIQTPSEIVPKLSKAKKSNFQNHETHFYSHFKNSKTEKCYFRQCVL